ncbi:hypothetical protein [Rhodococcus zopfii]|uniref:hypothetical protein n=1 Tax=Rhodococcus zopfii TaxID=43772 RepID=UPI003527BA5F
MTVLHYVPKDRPAGTLVTSTCGITSTFDDHDTDPEGVRSAHPLGEGDSTTVCPACRAVKTGKPVDGPLTTVQLVDATGGYSYIGWRLRFHSDRTVERIVTFGDLEISGSAQVMVDVAAGFLKAQQGADEAAEAESHELGWAVV